MSSPELNRSYSPSNEEEEKQEELEEELIEDEYYRSPSQSIKELNKYDQSLFLLHLFKDIFIELSPSTQISLILLSIGSFIIFISLPNQVIIGFIFLFIGICGIISIITSKYISFAQQYGLISLIKPSMIKHFILNGSIVDIFYEIRNSKLGIPDFLLSQILPLDDPEREMIFERLPEITRNFVSTEGLIYLTPQAIQNVILPMHLQRNNNNNNNNYNNIEYDLSDVPRLSPITGSPHSSQNNSDDNNNNNKQKSLKGGLLDMKNNNNNNNNAEEEKEEVISSKVFETKNEIESIGKQWLWKNQENINDINNNNNTALSVIKSTSSDLDTSSNDSNQEEEKKDIHDSDLNDEIPIKSGLLLMDNNNNNNNKNTKTNVSIIENENENNNAANISWIGQVGKLLTGNDTLATKPIIKAVIDTRMKELALQIISYVWKSPFSQISDIQLKVIFICCVGIVSFYLTKNKQIRNKFIKSMKYMGIMMLFWIGILCFIELNIRRKSKLFNNIYNYINKQLFHSEHHKAVRRRKKKHNLLQKSKSIKQIQFRKLKYKDKKSKFSKTMPYLKRPKKNNINIFNSPHDSNHSSMSNETDSQSQSLSPYSTHLKNKNNKRSTDKNVLRRTSSTDKNVLRRRNVSAFI